MRVLVIGGGVVGLSAAWALKRAGHEPVLFEQGPVPNPDAASHDQHRLIRFAYGRQAGYCRMVHDAYAAWARLWDDLGARHYVETGSLVLSTGNKGWARDSQSTLAEAGVAMHVLDAAELRARHPHLAIADDMWALWITRGGVLLADRILRGLCAWLAEAGVPLHAGRRIVALEADAGRVVDADGARHDGDAVVVAAGAWSERLVPEFRGRTRAMRQVVVYVEPPDDLAGAWARSPALVDFGGPEELYVVPPVAGTGLKFGAGAHRRPGDPDADRTIESDEREQMLAYYAPYLERLDAYRIIGHRVCYYTMANDQRFLSMLSERAAAVSGCSGHMFKFGAVMGERLAEAATGGAGRDGFVRWAAGG